MVVVKQGDLPAPGKQYRLYLNAGIKRTAPHSDSWTLCSLFWDRKRNKWYLRVTHSFPHTNRHFRAGTYDSKEEALKAAETLDPINPKVRDECFFFALWGFATVETKRFFFLERSIKTRYCWSLLQWNVESPSEVQRWTHACWLLHRRKPCQSEITRSFGWSTLPWRASNSYSPCITEFCCYFFFFLTLLAGLLVWTTFFFFSTNPSWQSEEEKHTQKWKRRNVNARTWRVSTNSNQLQSDIINVKTLFRQ